MTPGGSGCGVKMIIIVQIPRNQSHIYVINILDSLWKAWATIDDFITGFYSLKQPIYFTQNATTSFCLYNFIHNHTKVTGIQD